jgi:hypothetical protein
MVRHRASGGGGGQRCLVHDDRRSAATDRSGVPAGVFAGGASCRIYDSLRPKLNNRILPVNKPVLAGLRCGAGGQRVERQLPMRIVPFARAAYAGIFVAVAVSAPLGGAAHAADGCLNQPNAQSPPGSHWFYRVDRANHRRCWYLGAGGFTVRRFMSARPRPTTKPTPHATAETHRERPIAELLSAPTPAVTAGRNAGEVLSAFLPGQKAPVGPMDADATPDSTHAGDASTTDPADDMPLVWPVLTDAERAAFAPSAEAMFTPQHLPLLFVGALALAAVVGRGMAASASRKRSSV